MLSIRKCGRLSQMALESSEQIKYFGWVYKEKTKIPYKEEMDLIFHVPNGGSRNLNEARNLKRQGVKKGVPDIFVDIPRGKYHGLRIELKRTEKSKSKISEEQKQVLELYTKMGYYACVCYGSEEAIGITKLYLNGEL